MLHLFSWAAESSCSHLGSKLANFGHKVDSPAFLGVLQYYCVMINNQFYSVSVNAAAIGSTNGHSGSKD